MQRYRAVLTSFAITLKDTDPIAVLTLHKIVPVVSLANRQYTYTNKFITSPTRLPTSIAQLQNYFYCSKPQKMEGTVFANVLIRHNKEIADIMLDINEGIDQNNLKIGKQEVQHPDVVKLGYILYLTPKIDVQE